MAVTEYPVFLEGQTLTEADLNGVRDYLDDKDRLLGRLIGFGISCGLGGTIQTDGLHIAPGLAIDQDGEGLLLEEELVVALPPPGATATFNFVQGQDGFTPVLVAVQTDVPAPECDADGCEAHATVRIRTAEVVFARGQLTGTRFDFSGEPLLSQEPLRVRTASTVVGAFNTLKTAILNRLGTRISADARAKLTSVAIDATDLPAIQGFKAGFLNQVLFAALDLLRCEALTATACLRDEDPPGVALGWLRQSGTTTWEWDCDFRHAWEPPNGLTMAFIGGRCENACDLYVDRLEGMILSFEVPVVPAPEDPPDTGGVEPGDFDICKHPRYGRSRYGTYIIDYFDCPWVVVPPYEVKIDWGKHYLDDSRINPGNVDPVGPEVIYEIDQPDWAEAGRLGLEKVIGKKADTVADVLKTVKTDEGYGPDVVVVTADDVREMDGYMPATTVSIADSFVLTEDAMGKVVGVGVVPATKAIRSAPSEIPRATATADRAETLANGALDAVGSLSDGLNEAAGALETLTEFQRDTTEWRSLTDRVLSGLDGAITRGAQEAVADLQLRLTSQVDERIESSIDSIQTAILEQVRTEVDGVVSKAKAEIGKDIDATAKDLRTEFGTRQGEVTQKVGAIAEQVKGLEADVSNAARDAERGNTRIDQVLSERLR